jgi:hypothetical protein
MEQVRAAMDASNGDLEYSLVVPRVRGSLRLVVRYRHPSRTSWSMSVILNSDRFDGRIDCIDWEGSFVSIGGVWCSGFHRHVWDAKSMSCERTKKDLVGFVPASVEEFVIQGFALLGVVPRKESANDRSQMPLR